ncbi:MAG TPA: potassium-transporting ATPase subunit KdpA [Steroidobacteraceae bacterium]|jgi:K+-transporting ATPase ATPase A chain
MSPQAKFISLFVFCVGMALLLARPLGHYIAAVMGDSKARIPKLLERGERSLYRLAGVDPNVEMSWFRYARALLVFNLFGALLLYALARLQAHLPMNPQGFAAMTGDLSFNTAVSFVTNTDWQAFSGESAASYFTQMAGLALQNFLSAATGLAVAIALIRGFKRTGAKLIGNFWVDATRASLYVLLPLSLLLAVMLAGQGVIQNFESYKTATTVESLHYDNPKFDAEGNGLKDAAGKPLTGPAVSRAQILPMGPVASQEAIKELGTNGGGFFNANSAHPYENPTPFSNALEIIAILLIPFALTFAFGTLIGDTRQGVALLCAMLVLFATLAGVGFAAEQRGNPLLATLPIDQSASPSQSGGNLEGKETRFGIAGSTLFAAATTATSTGAVNSAHDSFMPMGGFVPMFLMQLGEVAPGGVGTGLYSMLIFAILGVFIAGLMIGRTPEYLGKKIEAQEMKLASIFILTTPILVLAGTAIAVMSDAGAGAVSNPGPHGFSEILYAFTSAGNNNGSAFAGLSANLPFYNVALGLVMWLGRFWPIVATLAVAGSLAAKKRVPVSEGTMPTHGPLFIVLLIGTILLIGVLNYVPALALGPVAEQFQLLAQ